MSGLGIYYWATYCFTMFAVASMPSKKKHSPTTKAIGAILLAMIGFLIWPLVLIALYKMAFCKSKATS